MAVTITLIRNQEFATGKYNSINIINIIMKLCTSLWCLIPQDFSFTFFLVNVKDCMPLFLSRNLLICCLSQSYLPLEIFFVLSVSDYEVRGDRALSWVINRSQCFGFCFVFYWMWQEYMHSPKIHGVIWKPFHARCKKVLGAHWHFQFSVTVVDLKVGIRQKKVEYTCLNQLLARCQKDMQFYSVISMYFLSHTWLLPFRCSINLYSMWNIVHLQSLP